MPKLNQIIAIEEATKKKEHADLSKAHHLFLKPALFNGFIRTFQPRFEDAIAYPEEKTLVQQNAAALLKQVVQHQSELFDVVATKDRGNCDARADVVVDGQVLAKDVPVTFLLYIEKRLVDFRTLIAKLPVLEPAKEWSHDGSRGMWVTPVDKKIKTRKIQKPIVKYEATKEHPAQTELVSIDEVEGTWNQIDMSTAFSADQVQAMLARIDKLEKAVKVAREEANSREVERRDLGSKLLGFLFG